MIEVAIIHRKINNPNFNSMSTSKYKNIVKVVNRWYVDDVSILLL